MEHFDSLFTAAGLFALANIIFIDVVMSGDNALLIGMATKHLAPKERKKAIAIGIFLATLLRIVFAAVAVKLLSIIGLKLAGGLLLLYVVYKLYREVRHAAHMNEAPELEGVSTFRGAVTSIVIADVSMSLDNVLAVAGASHGNYISLGIGLVVSIMLMAVASNYMAVLLKKFPQIQWIGLAILLYVALSMIYGGGAEILQFAQANAWF